MKILAILASFLTLSLFVVSCGGSDNNANTGGTAAAPKSMVPDPEVYDPNRGEGKFTAEKLAIPETIDEAVAKEGETISGVKCTSCHKITEEKLVGPGWKGVTHRRAPEWIMNFITNPDPMLDKDPQAQAMLELCLVRMPNQNLTDDEARKILEFMRKNDATN